MSYTAPQYYGYGPSSGGYAQFLNGEEGKSYGSKRATTQRTAHELARRNPKQNAPQNGETSVAGGGGTAMGIVLNEIRIDQHSRVMPAPVDAMGPNPERAPAALGHMDKKHSVTMNASY